MSNLHNVGMVTRQMERIQGSSDKKPNAKEEENVDKKLDRMQVTDGNKGPILWSWTGPDVRAHLEKMKEVKAKHDHL